MKAKFAFESCPLTNKSSSKFYFLLIRFWGEVVAIGLRLLLLFCLFEGEEKKLKFPEGFLCFLRIDLHSVFYESKEAIELEIFIPAPRIRRFVVRELC